MKKFGKFILALLIVAGVGYTGYTIGGNMAGVSTADNRDSEHIADMQGLKALLKI